MENREPTSSASAELPAGAASDATRSAGADSGVSAAAEMPQWLEYLAEPRHAVPILLILGVALYLINLGGYPLYTKGEPREAVTVFDIVHGGGVILPQRAGVEIPSKPLLMHWLAAIVSRATGGVNEFSVRLPSAALAIAGLLACFLYVRRLFDDVVALLAAVIMATAFQYLQAATGARVDMTLTFFMEIAFFEFILMAEGLTRRRLLLYVAIALAILTKGPVGLVLPAAVALVWIAIEHRWSVLGRMALGRGAVIVILLAGGWYAAAIVAGGPDFLRKQILAENLTRFIGAADFHAGHQHRFYYMELALLAGFMPWTLLLPIVVLRAAREPIELDARLKYVMLWFVVALVFYNLPQSKRGVYLLCLYPALSTLLAIYIRQTISRPQAVQRLVTAITRVAGVALLLTGAGALGALAMLVARQAQLSQILSLARIRAPLFLPTLASAVGEQAILSLALPLGVIAAGIFLVRTKPRIERVVAAVAVGMTLIAVATNLVIVPAIATTLSLKSFTDHAMKTIDGARVGYLGELNYDFAFYSRRTIPIVTVADPNLPDFLVGWRALYGLLTPEQRSRFTVVMVSNPTALDGSDEMVLLQKRGTPPPLLPKPDDGYIESSADPLARLAARD